MRLVLNYSQYFTIIVSIMHINKSEIPSHTVQQKLQIFLFGEKNFNFICNFYCLHIIYGDSSYLDDIKRSFFFFCRLIISESLPLIEQTLINLVFSDVVVNLSNGYMLELEEFISYFLVKLKPSSSPELLN